MITKTLSKHDPRTDSGQFKKAKKEISDLTNRKAFMVIDELNIPENANIYVDVLY